MRATSGTSASSDVYDSEAARTAPRWAKKSFSALNQTDSGETSSAVTIDRDGLNCVGSRRRPRGRRRSAELLRGSLHRCVEIVEAFEIHGSIGVAEIEREESALVTHARLAEADFANVERGERGQRREVAIEREKGRAVDRDVARDRRRRLRAAPKPHGVEIDDEDVAPADVEDSADGMLDARQSGFGEPVR